MSMFSWATKGNESLIVGQVVVFAVKNNVSYYQDFSSHVGAPDDVLLKVERIRDEHWATLSGAGYGKPGSYGNGKITVDMRTIGGQYVTIMGR